MHPWGGHALNLLHIVLSLRPSKNTLSYRCERWISSWKGWDSLIKTWWVSELTWYGHKWLESVNVLSNARGRRWSSKMLNKCLKFPCNTRCNQQMPKRWKKFSRKAGRAQRGDRWGTDSDSNELRPAKTKKIWQHTWTKSPWLHNLCGKVRQKGIFSSWILKKLTVF